MKYFVGIMISIMILYMIFRPSCGCERFTIYGALSSENACAKCIKPFEQKLKKLEKDWEAINEQMKIIKHGRSYIIIFENNTYRDNYQEKLATIMRIGIDNIYIAKKEDKKIIFAFTSKESILTDAKQKVADLDNVFADSDNNLVSDLKRGDNGKNKTLWNLGVRSIEYDNSIISYINT